MSNILLDDIFMNNNSRNNTIDNSKLTLWMGDLDPWMDENFIRQVWYLLGENVVVKLIRDKRTGLSSGYAFIGFSSIQSAQRALTTIHGSKIPNSQRTFRLNWASGGGICDRKENRAPEYSLFVGDLSTDIDETFLLSLFRTRFPSCQSVKIMADPLSGLSRGYGFVRFLNQQEQQKAAIEMNGIICNNRAIRVSFATPKNNYNSTRYLQLALQAPALIQQPTDPNNTTVFVGGLSCPVSEEELGHYFSPFGQVTYVKIPPGKGCGFVQFSTRQSAEQAIERMNGFAIGTSRIRLSWGRSQSDKSTVTTTAAVSNNTTMIQQPSFLFDCGLMSPTTTNTTALSSSIHNNNTTHLQLGSFRPLSPPQQFYQVHHQHESFQTTTTDDDWLNILPQQNNRNYHIIVNNNNTDGI